MLLNEKLRESEMRYLRLFETVKDGILILDFETGHFKTVFLANMSHEIQTPENHTLVFQRFRQVETTDNQILSGNDLGLSISSALVQKLGSRISVNSTLDVGSDFTFAIPYQEKMIV